MISFDPTGFIRTVIMSAGFAYPVRFACSFGLSTLIYFLISSMSADYPHLSLLRIVAESPKLFIMSAATVIAFWPALLTKNLRPDQMGAHIDTFSDIVDKSGLPEVQKRLLWRRFADKVIDQTVVSQPLDENRMRSLAKDAVNEAKDDGSTDPLLPS